MCASVASSIGLRRRWCGIWTTGAEVQIVRVNGERRRNFVVERQVWIGAAGPWYGSGAGNGQGKLRSVVVVATSKSAEGTTVDERKGISVVRNLEELAEEKKSLVHALHETARVFLAGLEMQKTLASRPWFPQKLWLGVDKNAWMKSLSYQVGGLHFKPILVGRF